MAITSVTLDGLELHNTANYTVGRATADALMSSIPYKAVTVEMQNAPPVFIRSQIEAKTIPLAVFIHGQTYAIRRANYDALLAKCGPGQHVLRWVDGGVARRLVVSNGPLLASGWLSRAVTELTAWNPEPSPG